MSNNANINGFDGKSLKEAGMKLAEEHANDAIENWSDAAYQFLLSYCKVNDTFMTEDVRAAAAGVLPEPPSNRAWGSIITKAAKAGIIVRVGYKEVKNPKAHCTPASLWRVNLKQ